jgi:hypothetical protein
VRSDIGAQVGLVDSDATQVPMSRFLVTTSPAFSIKSLARFRSGYEQRIVLRNRNAN